MLYKNSLNGITYKGDKGFGIVIYQNGTVKVKDNIGMLTFNYLSIEQFEEALVKGECPVYTIAFKSHGKAFLDELYGEG